MVDSSKAVFFSYASQDAEAARRICEALRAAQIEVWLDQSELVGGDAWDAKIRKQIAECALFVPVISANTQARLEGYFRIEWKLAAQRTHAMAEAKPFLLPVVIDEIRDPEAHVPAEFRTVQWTRLSGGTVTPQFVERVKKLLGAEVTGAFQPVSTETANLSHGLKTRATSIPRKPTASRTWMALAAVILIGATATFIATRTANPEPKPENPKPTDLSSDKSIAVLPFDNLSTDQENGFFADGIHEDVLTALQSIRELRVLSRTTMMQYRARGQKSLPQIARELGVAYILEGSVQRADNKVRVRAQLIDARTDRPLWTLPASERELKDIFALQAQLAKAIAAELKATISPQEKTLLEHRPTQNSAAYDLYLKAREVANITGTGRSIRTALDTAETFLQAAVKLDPRFVEAWAALAFNQSRFYGGNYDRTPARLEQAKSALDRAMTLAPDSPDVLHAAGFYYYSGFRDYVRAQEYFERSLQVRPNSPGTLRAIAGMRRQQGQWRDAIAHYRKAIELDPGNATLSGVFGFALERMRHYEPALAERRRRAGMMPDNLEIAFGPAQVAFRATGSTTEAMEFFARLTKLQADSRIGVQLRKQWAYRTGNLAEFLQLDRATSSEQLDDIEVMVSARIAAIVLAATGDMAGARARLSPAVLERNRERVRAEPTNDGAWRNRAEAEALLGNKDEALRCAREAVKLAPETIDAMDGPLVSRSLAFVYAWTGDKERALAEYARLLRLPGAELFVHEMRRSPEFHPLQGDSRFQALLDDPKNNAPLF